ncbi:MAG: ROK family protein [Firmicutes bacterium]|nr:ROK family protein [Bacillota bacterium]
MEYICVDIGGTEIKGGITKSGSLPTMLEKRTSVLTNAEKGFDEIIFSLDSLIDFFYSKRTAGIAISSAGTINPYSGKCIYATQNLPGFTGFNIKNYIEKKYSVRCSVINDGQAALLGEATYGVAREKKNIAMMTLGTGVGGAYFADDIVFGEDFSFGRFGHLCFVKEGRLCNCGKLGCVEQYVSTSVLIEDAREKLAVSNGKEFFEHIRANNIQAHKILESFLGDLASVLLKINELVDVKLFVIGGGVTGSADLWIPRLQKILPTKNIVVAQLGNDAGMLGAFEWHNRELSERLR